MAIIDNSITVAQQLLTAGEVVAIPTETVYGLAGNAYNEATIANIFHIKNRPNFDPLIVHAANLDQIQRFVKRIPEKALQLAHRFWPGPLTLLLERNDMIPDIVTSGLPNVGVRIPQHPLTLQLLQQLDFPLAAPSANPFGYISPTTTQHVQEQLGGQIPYILEGGLCAIGLESTIVGFVGEQPVVYRLGGVSIEAIEQIVGPVEIAQYAHKDPRAPGMLENHYAPKKPLIVGNIPTLVKENGAKRVGILALQQSYPTVPANQQVILSPTGNLDEAAHNLFAALRTLDSLPVALIFAEPVPNLGIGRAINDRLKRAAKNWRMDG